MNRCRYYYRIVYVYIVGILVVKSIFLFKGKNSLPCFSEIFQNILPIGSEQILKIRAKRLIGSYKVSQDSRGAFRNAERIFMGIDPLKHTGFEFFGNKHPDIVFQFLFRDI